MTSKENDIISKLQEIVDWNSKDLDNQEIYLIKANNEDLYGLLYISLYTEDLDNHCAQCMDEDLPLKFRLNNDINYLSVVVGKTKFNRIKSGELKTSYHIIKKCY